MLSPLLPSRPAVLVGYDIDRAAAARRSTGGKLWGSNPQLTSGLPYPHKGLVHCRRGGHPEPARRHGADRRQARSDREEGHDAPLRVHIAVDESTKPEFPLEPYIQTDYGHLDVPAGTLVIPLTSRQTKDGMLGTHLKIAAINSIHNLLPANLPTVPNRALAYQPNVTLSFVVLNEDASEGSYVEGWDVEAAIRDHFKPTLEPLAPLFNFSIESQVLYHAPLTFEPTQQEDGSWAVDDEQIKVFVSEHWNLDSKSTNNPVLRFMLFVPSAKHRPMSLPGTDASDTFLLPQFGSVVILNPPSSLKEDASYHLTESALDQPFSQFTSDFYKLLAIPTLPEKLHPCPEKKATKTRASRGVSEPFSPWQLDTALRMRHLENAREARKTLGGIVRLIDKIEEMEIHAAVREKILGAIAKLEQLPAAAKEGVLASALLSRDAVGLANEAFFDPSMMGLLYFPDQHKFAVYAPLFAPIGVSLVAGLVKEIRAWKARKKAKKAQTEPAAASVTVEKDMPVQKVD
ncbi:hypothetical protein A1Q1_01824 [Trichosporon asahii var. asahii CBS 2479]|uniref:Phosphatidylinositol glycan, class S n=1 Tax=Trichosporon asahii var. asahii (strain ATCC 90039 / CBS 2479 / JCM 2466 / KCTC 7840 / NBRC 103889/ NCYC 2677 / UAMH 7654) TaxID=1186058 RepID=J6F6S8_TRIAS|nr:hypothetical protein A1Q1_01824 [Trichosporon asahii var. asahii CBS 2479]EJT52784.1 hypothetical protein A1Q1_01824 [Trichosporon asahii var. asahii CBS 2479]